MSDIDNNEISESRPLSADECKRYRASLVALMSYNDDFAYSKDHHFTQQQLGALTPNHICRFLAFKAYGKPNPTEDDHPTLCRANTLLFHKKAISAFMPNPFSWNSLANVGNPTKAMEVNRLIKKVRKKEVRKLGKESLAR